MIKVGVTGGIGSGKTTLCKEWEKSGAFVVYADDVAKKIMVENEELIAQIKSTFGESSYHPDGSLNRSYLAEEAFEKGRVEDLNKLVHPSLWKEVAHLADKKKKEGIDVFVKEAAILLQYGRPKDLDFVVLVTADLNSRVNRVVERDNSQKELVLDRVSKQQDFNKMSDQVDYIISNDGSLEELKSKAQALLKEIKKF
tara:strand:- start:5949 stop:6542 length:594 start_codon:yes stop_codon:yes gene_type:complete